MSAVTFPPESQWGSWDVLPETPTVENPTPEQEDLLVRIGRLKAMHPGWFESQSPGLRQWLLRRSYTSVTILIAQLQRAEDG